jgi:hypothetical protein
MVRDPSQGCRAGEHLIDAVDDQCIGVKIDEILLQELSHLSLDEAIAMAGRGIGSLDGFGMIDSIEEGVPRRDQLPIRGCVAEADDLTFRMGVPQKRCRGISHVGERVTPCRRHDITELRSIHVPPL